MSKCYCERCMTDDKYDRIESLFYVEEKSIDSVKKKKTIQAGNKIRNANRSSCWFSSCCGWPPCYHHDSFTHCLGIWLNNQFIIVSQSKRRDGVCSFSRAPQTKPEIRTTAIESRNIKCNRWTKLWFNFMQKWNSSHLGCSSWVCGV